MTKLCPKFEIGQRVFFARVTWTGKDVQCPDCLGQKEWTVSLPSGEVFKHPCRTCMYGYFCTGLVKDWADHPLITQYTIGSIQTDTASDNPVRYMCQETGVGSGGVYDENRLFATEAEAKAFCEVELVRVRGVRQAEEMRQRKVRKSDSLIHGDRKKKRKPEGDV